MPAETCSREMLFRNLYNPRIGHLKIRIHFAMILILLLASIYLLNCSDRGNRFKPIYYFPIKTGHSWVFNGEIHKLEIVDVSQDVGDKIVTFAYYDSLSTLLWNEQYNLIKNQIYLRSFEPRTKVLPSISFEPALPFAPISAKVGHKMQRESIETQTDSDSLEHTMAILVEYLVEAVEDVKVPAGTFLDCVKMKINIIYPPSPYRPYFIGEQYWWFAPLVGPVKYDLPSARGELVSMKVSRSRQLQPNE